MSVHMCFVDVRMWLQTSVLVCVSVPRQTTPQTCACVGICGLWKPPCVFLYFLMQLCDFDHTHTHTHTVSGNYLFSDKRQARGNPVIELQ